MYFAKLTNLTLHKLNTIVVMTFKLNVQTHTHTLMHAHTQRHTYKNIIESPPQIKRFID